MRLRYVITGTAGGGTAWAADVLTELGSPCGHQRFYGGGSRHRSRSRPRPGTPLEGESSWLAARDVDPTRLPVLILVRNPLAVVRSLSVGYPRFLTDDDPNPIGADLVRRCAPHVLHAPDPISRLLRYASTWTAPLERAGHPARLLIMRLEDLNDSRAALASAVHFLTGRSVDLEEVEQAQRTVGTRVNSHGGKHSQLTWDDVLALPDGQLLAERAKRYGYPVG